MPMHDPRANHRRRAAGLLRPIGLAALLTVIVPLLGARADEHASPRSPRLADSISEHNARVAERIRRSVVGIRTRRAFGRHAAPAATGVLCGPRLVLTARSALPDTRRLEVVAPDGPSVAARLLHEDPARDVALLELESPLPPPACPAVFGSPGTLEPGSVVYTVGNPFRALVRDGEPALSLGVVSAIYPLPEQEGAGVQAIETDAAVNPGSFGGPLLDHDGRVVGLVVPALRRDRLLGLAVPVEDIAALQAAARRAAESRPREFPTGDEQTATNERGMLGIYLYDDDERPVGAEIVKVKPGSPAARAGLRAHDIVRRLGDQPVRSSAQLARRLRRLRAGERVRLLVERDGWQREFQLVAAPAGGPRASGRPFIGVALQATDRGLRVTTVQPGSPADKAGLRRGDLLLAIERKGTEPLRLDRPGALPDFLRTKKPGDTVVFHVERDGWRRTLPVRLGARPSRRTPSQPEPRTPQARARGYLGAYLAERDGAVLVDELVPHGPAARAGLRAGDRIVSVDGTPVRGLADLRAALRGRAAGDTVSLGVQRAGTRHTIRVTLGARPHTAAPAHGEHAPQARRPAPRRGAPHDRRETARPYLGLELEQRDGSLWITRVLEGSPAAEVQLEPGWQLRKVDGRSVSQLDDVAKLLADKRPGDLIALELQRRVDNGNEVEVKRMLVTITLDAQPGPPQDAEPQPGYLGLLLEDGPDGLQVVEVVEGGPAAAAGVAAGEQIVAIDGTPVRSLEEFGRAFRRHHAGDTIVLTLAGKDGVRDVSVRLGARKGGS